MLGPVGSGKGSYSKVLAKEYGFKHLSTGDLLREEISSGSALGQDIKNKVDAGEFVPDDLMIEMIGNRMEGDCILDGFPRNLKQAELLKDIDKVVFLDVPDEVVIERLTQRRMCKKCGRIYGLNDMPSGSTCECGGELYQRDDDKEEVVRERLETYHRLTEPLIDFYSEKGLLIKINANDNFDIVLERIKEALSL